MKTLELLSRIEDEYSATGDLGITTLQLIRGAIEAAQTAPVNVPVEPQAQEPAEYQYRMMPMWGNLEDNWTDWTKCSAESYADYVNCPVLHDWKYEVRKLYAAPVSAVNVPSGEQYTEQQRMEVTGGWINGWNACRKYVLSAAPSAPANSEDAEDSKLIKQVRDHVVSVVRAFGEKACADYLDKWHKVEHIEQAIAATAQQKKEGE